MSDLNGITQTLVTSAARTTSGNSGNFSLLIFPDEIRIILKVTAQSGTTPTLDVYLQTSTDGGTNYVDVGHFTQVTTTTPTRSASWSVSGAAAPPSPDTLTGDAVIAANSWLNGPIDPKNMRVKWVIAGTTPSYTFSVLAILTRWRASF